MKRLGTIMVGFAMLALFGLSFAQTPEPPKTTEPVTSATPAATLKVEKIACGIGVAERELQGQDTVFAESTEKVYCWSLVMGGSEGTTVSHVWYHGDKEIARVQLPANYPRSRIWSYKSMYSGWKGDWKVEVVDAANQVLRTVTFKIQ